jgi:formimidoylglutamate deiminase
VIKYFEFKGILQREAWLAPAYVGVDNAGTIQYLSSQAPDEATPIEYVNGFAIPGFQNAHSHAFQYAMAGMAETHPAGSSDDFWSWREAMYRCALSMNPEQVKAVAAMLYTELLKKGYTNVAEFHYLHHDKDGKPYQNLAEIGANLVEAAALAGIKITLIPIFYQKGGFGTDPQPRQRRFISSNIDDYFQLLDDSAHAIKAAKHARLGFGVHSLRAVDAPDVIRTFREGPKNIPFHLHAAEQLKEVDDCVAHLKKRPIEWLLQNLPLSDRFHIVHCTHMTDQEVMGLAESKTNAVLCPGTEGNLGDGIFRLTDFARHGGSWSIGTDSHISINPVEDLRWLDYAQRFTTHKRNTFDNGAAVLVNQTISAGRKAMGNSAAEFFTVGEPMDAVVYDADAPLLSGQHIQHLLPAIIYTTDSSAILGTMMNGTWIVRNQRHEGEKAIRTKFKQVIKSLSFE